MIRLLHFADAHIDITAHGRQDPASGLPLRVLDFLKSLDAIIDAAIDEQVDGVIFAGDAYKNRTPVPTFQREWGKRIVRLSAAGIPTLLLVGNHDLSPALGRANALQEFDTLQVPYVHVLGKPCFLKPEDLDGLALQVLALPWVSRASLMAALEPRGADLYEEIESRLSELVREWLKKIDPSLPVVLTAHTSVQGALYGTERSVMLGNDLVLPGSLVRDPRLDYVALGHIHKAQNLNENAHPPVVYSGSIERVDFGEAGDDKFYVIAHIERGSTRVEWRRLQGRRFIDRAVRIEKEKDFQKQVIDALPPQSEMTDAIVRLIVEYPRRWEDMLDEVAVRRHAESAFEFHFIRRPQVEARLRLPEDKIFGSLSALEKLDIYWKTISPQGEDAEALQKLAGEIIAAAEQPPEPSET